MKKNVSLTGKTTRLIDKYVQIFFKEGFVICRDTANLQEDNLQIMGKIKDRLSLEHLDQVMEQRQAYTLILKEYGEQLKMNIQKMLILKPKVEEFEYINKRVIIINKENIKNPTFLLKKKEIDILIIPAGLQNKFYNSSTWPKVKVSLKFENYLIQVI